MKDLGLVSDRLVDRPSVGVMWFGLPIGELAVVLPCLSIIESFGQPYRKDATNEKKFVLQDSGIEQSHPFTMVVTVWYDRVVPHASGCVAFSRSHVEVKVFGAKLTNERVDGMREMRVDRLQA